MLGQASATFYQLGHHLERHLIRHADCFRARRGRISKHPGIDPKDAWATVLAGDADPQAQEEEGPKCLSRNEILDLSTVQHARAEGTSQVKHMTWSAGLSVTADGTGVVAHAGSVAVRLLADRVGLTGALSGALTRRSFRPVHDRGRVLVDLAVLLGRRR